MVWDICWAADPKAVEVRRSEFHFFQRNADFLCIFWCFSGAPEHKKKHKNTPKKTQFIPQKNTMEKKTQVIPQKNTIHITKEIKKHKSYQKKTPKTNTIHTTKKHKKKNKVIFLFVSASVSVFSASFLFFFLFLFCFFSAFGKLLLLKHFQVASPAQFQPPLSQPAPQASSPPTPSAPPSPRLSPQAQSSSPGLLYVLYTHSLLFCYRRCDGQHPKP